MNPIAITIAAFIVLFSVSCKPPPKPRVVTPESRDKHGKLTRAPVTWKSDGTPDNVQWIHDHCAGVDPIPPECFPYLASTATPSGSVTPKPTATATAAPSASATATTTPTATAKPTATATPSLCVVPNLIGTKIKDAQGAWEKAGFTTQVQVTSGAPGHQIASQSLPAGSQGDCNKTLIRVSNQ